MKGKTVRKVAVRPDFRSLAPQWSEKSLLYYDWAEWREAGQYLPGEKKTAGRKQHPGHVKFIDDYNAGRHDGLSIRQLAEQYGVGKTTISNWKKGIPDDVDEL